MGEFINSIREVIKESKIEKVIKNKWDIFMKTKYNISPTDKNVSAKEFKLFEIQEIYIKKYGFDAVISIPYSKDITEFRSLIPAISAIYKAEIIAELTNTNSAIYMRVHILELPIDELDKIKFKWYMRLYDNKQRNSLGQTYQLHDASPIYHPTRKENGKKITLGYRFNLDIPNELNYNTLSNQVVDLNRVYRNCLLTYDNDTGLSNIEILNTKLSDDEKYEPIKVKPWELYMGMTHAFKPIILDFSKSANLFLGGTTGSGKTVALIMALTNLLIFNDENKINLFITMLSDKQDLKMFKKCKQTKHYANTLDLAKAQLNYLSKEVARRNRLFDEADEDGGIVNIYEYNKVSKKKLPLLYFILDEVASFAVNGSEGGDDTHTKEEVIEDKEYCNALLWKLAREGRSAGVYCCLCSQRGSLTNISGDIKGMLSNTVCFFFPNMPSALTILGDGDLAKLAVNQRETREFIFNGNKINSGKSLYLNNDMVKDFLKPLKPTNHKLLELSKSGKVVDIKDEIQVKNIKNNENITENEQNLSKNTKKVTVFNPKTHKYEIKYIESDEKPKRNSGRFRR